MSLRQACVYVPFTGWIILAGEQWDNSISGEGMACLYSLGYAHTYTLVKCIVKRQQADLNRQFGRQCRAALKIGSHGKAFERFGLFRPCSFSRFHCIMGWKLSPPVQRRGSWKAGAEWNSVGVNKQTNKQTRYFWGVLGITVVFGEFFM